MNGQRLILAEAVCTPNLIEEEILVQRPACILRQQKEQLILLHVEFHGLSVQKNFPGILVNGDAA